MNEVWREFDRYVSDVFELRDPVLEEVVRRSVESGLPEIQVSRPQGRMLEILARATGAKRVLEIGTLGGYSAICLARGVAQGGQVVTLEVSEKHAEVARGNIELAGFTGTVEIRVGDAAETMAALHRDGEGPFDLVFIDADKRGYPNYLRLALPLVRPGSLIIADNVVRDGAVADPNSSDPDVMGARAFNAAAGASPGLRGTVLQTVGNKGYDGFAIAVVTEPVA